MDELSHFEKLLLYRNNCYRMKPPPVLSIYWTEDDWVRYIDREGQWVDLDALPEFRAEWLKKQKE